jgi:hypothetical protein
MHVHVIINMHEHMALLTEGNRSNSQQLSCSIASMFVLSLLHVSKRLPFAIILYLYTYM